MVYRVRTTKGIETTLEADNVNEAVTKAMRSEIELFVRDWLSSINSVVAVPDYFHKDCAVDQNEVVCAHPGCTGPYNCKERGLQE